MTTAMTAKLLMVSHMNVVEMMMAMREKMRPPHAILAWAHVANVEQPGAEIYLPMPPKARRRF